MTSQYPKISIIVPVYNTEKYLKKCIQSILNQTFSDFELILVDDGSTDESGGMCDHFALIDSRIIVVHKQNSGVSSARNTGIKISKGKYIMFCDSDDSVEPQWCELFYIAIEKYPKNYIVSNIWLCSKEHKVKKSNMQFDNLSDLSYFDIFKMGLSGYSVNKIFDKNTVIQNNIFFDEKLNLGEDAIFNIDYFKMCEKITYIKTPTYFYQNNQNSLMHAHHNNILELYLPLFYKRTPLIKEENLSEFCDIYLYLFINMFDDIFKEHNKSLLFKLQYNQRMLNSKEFRFCLEHASGKNESPIFLKILRTNNYYILYVFQKVTHLFNKLKGK